MKLVCCLCLRARGTGLFAFVLLLSAARASADSVAPQDFAFGLTLQPTSQASLHRFTLPERVLAGMTDDDLGDLCVFDARGVQRPLALHSPFDPAHVQHEISVGFFPLETSPTRPSGASEATEVQVERDPTGRITRAVTRTGALPDGRKSYLIDLSGVSETVVALLVRLQGPADFMRAVQVEASDDLNAFRLLTTATVAHLRHDDRDLSNEVIDLPTSSQRYLRLTLEAQQGERDAQAVDLTLGSLQVRVERKGKPVARSFVTLHPRPRTNLESQHFKYTLPGAFLIDRYLVELPSSTPLAEVTLLASATEDGPYRALARQQVLRARQDDASELPNTYDNFFELRVSDKGGGIARGEPTLRLGYRPQQLLFASANAEPYVLAYGSAKGRCKRFEEDELRGLGTAPTWENAEDTVRATAHKALAGKAALAIPEAPRPLRIYALWAVLLVAVGVLAWVTRKLLRNLDQK